MPDYAKAKVGIKRIFGLLDRIPKIDNWSIGNNEIIENERINAKISYDDVQFSYPMRQEYPVLKKLSLTVESGQKVALVGSSGCGRIYIYSLV